QTLARGVASHSRLERISAKRLQPTSTAGSPESVEIARNLRSGDDFAERAGESGSSKTGWRITQSDTNRSPQSKFPDKQGKNREFLRFDPLLDRMQPGNAPERLSFWRNSLRSGTGNYCRRDQGISN